MSKLYIAYGSNLNLGQMARRCPTATVYGRGTLRNWALVFRGAPNNAHATIERRKGSSVPVLVWEIQAKDEARLDRYEGFPVYYYKDEIPVYVDGIGSVDAMVYIMDRSRIPALPSGMYVDTIRVGYRECGLSMAYLDASIQENAEEVASLPWTPGGLPL